ncbi:hypothetical protein OUZ56_017492 [Daphnia magna]|uniref:Uncharacterized protein n=1 Tax=Daphnia magna TaxID=35525 RepID=A0ABR0ASW3_9CRUS|nr:hypothetical protein OUZ56_017492 [Daphnia magna]
MDIFTQQVNQREMLDTLSLLLKDSAPSQPDLSSITELFQLPMKDFDDAKNFEKLLRVQNNKSKMDVRHPSDSSDSDVRADCHRMGAGHPNVAPYDVGIGTSFGRHEKLSIGHPNIDNQ